MKKKYLYLLFCLFLVTFSCEKLGENPVNGPVNLRLDLLNRDKILKVPPSYRVYLYSRRGVDYNPERYESLGLGGLLIVHTVVNGYFAFDLACPNEQNPNPNTIVEVDADGMNAVCPKCGTKYEIWHGTGIALEDQKYGLRSYPISVNGNSGIVSN